MKKHCIALVFCVTASAVFAAVKEVADVSALASSYGNDTVKYTGSTASSSAALTLDAGEKAKATTFAVENESAVLSLTGPFTLSHLFFKTGPGVLDLAIADGGDVSWPNEGSCYAVPSAAVSWSDGAATGSFMGFNVTEGTLKWSGTGTLSGYNLTVGNFTELGPKAATLELAGGDLEIDNTLILGLGNGVSATSAVSTVKIDAGTRASVVHT